MHVGQRGWKNSPADGQDFATFANCFGEVSGDVGERGEKKISKIVADQSAAGMKTVLEKTAEQRFVLGKRDHAVANIARWQNAIFTAQAAGAASVVGHCDDGSEIRNGALGIGIFVVAADDVLFSPRRSVDRPVPPPRATMRNPREMFFGLAVFFFTCGRCELIFDQIAGDQTAGRFFKRSAGGAVFLRIQQFSEARIFLEEGEVFIVTRVIAIFRFELNGYFQIGHRGVRFAGEAIESGEGVMNVIGFGGGAAGFIQAFAGVIPTAHVHHGDAALIMFVGGTRILIVKRLHALLGNFYVHAGAIGEFFAGAFHNFFEFLLGARKFLLPK